ncbi:MAG: hypothetical protein AAF065_03870 [Verrucomicrobiota bacterium]
MNLNHQKTSFHQKALIPAALAGLLASTASVMGQVPPEINWPTGYPEWWYDADPAKSMIDVSSLDNPGNWSPILQGQLLHIADIGIQELDEQLGPIGGAGFTVDDFRDPTKTPSYYSPAAIGQLKYVVSKFYDRFAEIGYQPGSTGWNPAIVLDEGMGDNSLLYPWKDDQTPENMNIALIGQAKHLFSWDLIQWASRDEDIEGPDGLPDFWEEYWFGDLVTASGIDSNWDGDAFTDLEEFQLGFDPRVIETVNIAVSGSVADTDGDLLSDAIVEPIENGSDAILNSTLQAKVAVSGTACLIVVPGEGYYAVNQANRTLNKLGN